MEVEERQLVKLSITEVGSVSKARKIIVLVFRANSSGVVDGIS